MIPRLPLDFIGVTGPFTKTHLAIDLGWNKFRGEPVYAAISGKVILNGFYKDAGNLLVVANDDGNKTVLTRYLHLRDKVKYKIGDNISQNEIIGYMGDTGNARGVHLHFEYWICPTNYKYKLSDIYKYALNPLEHCYVLDNMRVSKDDINKVRYQPKVVDSEIDVLKEKLTRIKQIIEE